jgi:hypothetical protein
MQCSDLFYQSWEYISHSCHTPLKTNSNTLKIVIPVLLLLLLIGLIVEIKIKKYYKKRQFLENIPVMYPAIKFKLKDEDKEEIVLFKKKYRRCDGYFIVSLNAKIMNVIDLFLNHKNIRDLQYTTLEEKEEEEEKEKEELKYDMNER